jgi:hypothetical protein
VGPSRGYTSSRWRDGKARPLAVFFYLLHIRAREARLPALADEPKSGPKSPQNGPKVAGLTHGHSSCKASPKRNLRPQDVAAGLHSPRWRRPKPQGALPDPVTAIRRRPLLNQDERNHGLPAVPPARLRRRLPAAPTPQHAGPREVGDCLGDCCTQRLTALNVVSPAFPGGLANFFRLIANP